MQDGNALFAPYFLQLSRPSSAEFKFDVETILPLLRTVFNSILEVFLLCLSGFILARRGLLNSELQKKLNVLNVTLFTPALLFSKVAFSLTPEKLKELWIVPICFVLITGLSMVVAFILSKLCRLKSSQRRFAMAAAMFMNSNSLPIALMQSIVTSVPGLKWGTNDSHSTMLGRALTYLLLYSTLGMILRWSYGVKLLSEANKKDFFSESSGESASESDSEDTPLLGANIQNVHPSTSTLCFSGQSYFKPTHLRRHQAFYNSFPNSPGPTTPSDLDDLDDARSDSDVENFSTTHEHHPHHVRGWRSSALQSWAGFQKFMTAPLWASLLSIVVACVPPLQMAMKHYLPPVKGALQSAGNCSIPITLIVLGAYFYPSSNKGLVADAGSQNREGCDVDGRRDTGNVGIRENLDEGSCLSAPAGKKSAGSLARKFKEVLFLNQCRGSGRGDKGEVFPGETKTVAVAVLSRMVVAPLLMLPLMGLAAKFDWHELFADPVFVVSSMLLVWSPPALTLAQITQAASGDAFERLISQTLFWSYCVLTVPTTLFSTILGLIFARL